MTDYADARNWACKDCGARYCDADDTSCDCQMIKCSECGEKFLPEYEAVKICPDCEKEAK